VLMRMAHGGLLPRVFESTSKKHGTPVASVAISATLMFMGTLGLGLGGFKGEEMYDLLGSMAVFGFLTAYALVAVALPFARRALGQHSVAVMLVSIATVVVMGLIVVYDLRSASDARHALIPWIYIGYLGAGLLWALVARAMKKSAA
jgi:amino acid transporter